MSEILNDLSDRSIDKLDEHCLAIYLEIPGSQIVVLQAYFDHYESVGIVRTLSVAKSLVCILTTPSMLKDCFAILNAIRDTVAWRFTDKPCEAERELYHGYFRKGKTL